MASHYMDDEVAGSGAKPAGAMSAGASPTLPPLSLKTRYGYASGAIANGVKNVSFSAYLMFFYNQVVGVPAAIVSAALAATLLIDALIEPTRIYVKSLLPIVRDGLVDAMAHITGGGLLENIPRVLPADAHAEVDADGWDQPGLMAFLQAQGNIEPEEMARTFNCGVGMVVVVPDSICWMAV